MNDQQLTELKELQELTFEAVKIDCDSRNWNGYNKIPQEMTKVERGGRNFDLKNADKSLAIFARITNIIDTQGQPTLVTSNSGSALELAQQLADPASPLQGAGLVAYSNQNAYPSTTVGYALNAILKFNAATPTFIITTELPTDYQGKDGDVWLIYED